MADETSNTPAEDAKAKMREALERKKAGGAHGPAGASGGKGVIGGAHVKAGGKREFRRKSS